MNRLATTTFVLCLLVSIGTDAAAQNGSEIAPGLVTARPSVQLGNVDAPEVEIALVSVEARHDYKGRVTITLVAENLVPGPDGPILPFFEDERVRPGGRLAVRFGDLDFRGRIRAVRSEMHPGQAPRIVLEATAVDYEKCDQDVRELHPDHFEGEIRAPKSGSTPARSVSGQVVEGAPLIAGMRLQLVGVGPWFDEVYVTETAVHGWDAIDGYRTSFTAVAATPPTIAKPPFVAKPGAKIDLRKPGACATLAG